MKGWSHLVSTRIEALEGERIVERLWDRDASLWPDLSGEVEKNLGWLDLPGLAHDRVKTARRKLASLLEGVNRIVLCGMGGSSLTPLVASQILHRDPSYPVLRVIDTTDPREISSILETDWSQTLLIIASKSGTTVEPLVLKSVFSEAMTRAGADPAKKTVVLTDPGTPLEKEARQRRMMMFETPPDVGGRYSALSSFGLVPLTAAGYQTEDLAVSGQVGADACRQEGENNPGLLLGAFLGELATRGIDKLILEDQPPLLPAGWWVEQLVAESLGKNGRGIIPVWRSSPSDLLLEMPDVQLVRQGANATAGKVDPQIPFHPLAVPDPGELGNFFFTWEFATAVAGHILRVNPFDQPDVGLAKRLTSDGLKSLAAGKTLIDILPPVSDRGKVKKALESLTPGSYVTVLLYLPPTEEYRAAAEEYQEKLEASFARPVLIQFGPRYLHSTGQIFKGGPANGTFLFFAAPPEPLVPIPGLPYALGELELVQAAGDYLALKDRKRQALWLPLPDSSIEALKISFESIC